MRRRAGGSVAGAEEDKTEDSSYGGSAARDTKDRREILTSRFDKKEKANWKM